MNNNQPQHQALITALIAQAKTHGIQDEQIVLDIIRQVVDACAQTVEHINMQGGGNLGHTIKRRFFSSEN